METQRKNIPEECSVNLKIYKMPEPISLTTALIAAASTLAASGITAGVGAASSAKKESQTKN